MTLDSILSAASFFFAVVTFLVAHFVSKYRDRIVANREIYQQLELASLDLFRFEADHLELIKPLWEAGAPPPTAGTAANMAFVNYACQNLNLFEMCVRFRQEKVVPEQVFCTWVMWFYNLSQAPGFGPVWAQVRLEYSRELREILDLGDHLAREPRADEAKQRAFFERVATLVNCDIVRTWLDRPLVAEKE